jgi:hypothetical protein
MAAEVWAAWVQAIGSILAIGAGFATMYLQNRHSDRAQEAERARRAEVVAYRLSGWMGEAGIRIARALKVCKDAQTKIKQGPPRIASELIPAMRLGMVSDIDSVLSDIHYFLRGSGDIAQLDHLIRAYEGWLDRLGSTRPGSFPIPMAEYSMREFYEYAERQLRAMSELQANAERHISPLVQGAIDGGR